jgi:asparagine synthase (glutamine-hydrolysing)
VRTLPVPTELDILANLPLGEDEAAPDLPAPRGLTVRAALEEAMLPALARTPCLVSFSGGRDSSAVLAVAVDVARRNGLPDPIPATKRYPGAPLTEESEWQDLVVEHLGLAEHVVIEVHAEHGELDALGPASAGILRRHGVRWPGNAYMHVPVFEMARGGALLTGVGGDELFGTTASRFVLVARGRARPRPRDLVSTAFGLAPRPLRAAVLRTRAPVLPWLTKDASARVAWALARDTVSAPHRWDTALHHWHRSRAFAAVQRSLPELGQHWDVAVVNPLVEPGVLAELPTIAGPTGFSSRSAAMTELFGDLLPPALLTRGTKASFGAPIWGPTTRAFVSAWTGEGVDRADVDVDGLRAEWSRPEPNFMTILLHTAWLHAQGGGDQASASSS